MLLVEPSITVRVKRVVLLEPPTVSCRPAGELAKLSSTVFGSSWSGERDRGRVGQTRKDGGFLEPGRQRTRSGPAKREQRQQRDEDEQGLPSERQRPGRPPLHRFSLRERDLPPGAESPQSWYRLAKVWIR
jgi:hypothetical protein